MKWPFRRNTLRRRSPLHALPGSKVSPETLTWAMCQGWFQVDQTTRDIYVVDPDDQPPTNEGDWQKVLEFLKQSGAPLEFIVEGEPQPVPDRVADLFASPTWFSRWLSADLGGLQVRTHFFLPMEIEFDVSPEDISSDER